MEPVSAVYLLRLDAAALRQLIQRPEEGAGTRDGRVTRLDASLHTRLRHPVHHSSEGNTQHTNVRCDLTALLVFSRNEDSDFILVI